MKDRDKEFVKWATEDIKRPDIKNEYEIFDEDSEKFIKRTFYSYSNIDECKEKLKEYINEYINEANNKIQYYNEKLSKIDDIL